MFPTLSTDQAKRATADLASHLFGADPVRRAPEGEVFEAAAFVCGNSQDVDRVVKMMTDHGYAQSIRDQDGWFYYTLDGKKARDERLQAALLVAARDAVLTLVVERLQQAPDHARYQDALLAEVKAEAPGPWQRSLVLDWIAEDPRLSVGRTSFSHEVVRLVDPESAPRDRKISLNITRTTDQQLSDLVAYLGTGTTTTEVIRRSVDDIWSRTFGRDGVDPALAP